MNFAETFRELWAGMIYMGRRFRGRETDVQARRDAALEGVFGRSRYEIMKKRAAYDEKTKDSVAVSVDVNEVVHVGEERQWLGVGGRLCVWVEVSVQEGEERELGRED